MGKNQCLRIEEQFHNVSKQKCGLTLNIPAFTICIKNFKSPKKMICAKDKVEVDIGWFHSGFDICC